MSVDLSLPATQAALGELVGVSQQAIGAMMAEGKLPAGLTLGQTLRAYCERLREQAAGRMGEDGGLDLVQERAALARSQREAQDMKNAVARGHYAPVGLLSDVLAAASGGMVDRLDQFEGNVRKACPDVPQEAVETLLSLLAAARNEWIRATQNLVAQRVDALMEEAAVTEDLEAVA